MPSFFDKESAVRIGMRISVLRHLRGLTTHELAERAKIGQTRLHNIEHGKLELRVSEVRRLCEILNVTIDEIIGDGFKV